MNVVVKIIVIFSFLSLWACQSKILDVEIEEQQPVYVIDAVISNRTNPVFRVFQTANKLNQGKRLPAIVSGELNTIGQHYPLHKIDSVSFTIPDFEFEKGESYELVFENSEGQKINAATTVPESSLEIDVHEEEGVNDGYRRFRIRIKKENEKYFCLKGVDYVPNYIPDHESDTIIRKLFFNLESSYSFVEYFIVQDNWLLKPQLNFADAHTLPRCFSNLYFSDNYFKNNEFEIVVDISDFSTSLKKSIIIEVLNNDYWEYLKSLQIAQENAGNEFATPAQVYTNVENGAGVFVGKWQYVNDILWE